MRLLGGLTELSPTVDMEPRVLQEQLLLKLVANCCANPLTALLHCRNGGLLHNEGAARVWEGVVRECKAVFGEQLPGTQEQLMDHVASVVTVSRMNINSMLQDVTKGGVTEIGYLNGYVAEQGRRIGVPCPWNEALVALVRAREGCSRDMLELRGL